MGNLLGIITAKEAITHKIVDCHVFKPVARFNTVQSHLSVFLDGPSVPCRGQVAKHFMAFCNLFPKMTCIQRLIAVYDTALLIADVATAGPVRAKANAVRRGS